MSTCHLTVPTPSPIPPPVRTLLLPSPLSSLQWRFLFIRCCYQILSPKPEGEKKWQRFIDEGRGLYCFIMFMSMPKGSSSPDDDDEIELSLGLSIGRGFGKSPKLQNSGEELTDVVVTSPNTAVRNWFLRCESDSRHGDTEGNCRERKRKRNETPERSIERETVDSIGCKTNSSDPQVLVVRSFSLNQGDRELVAGGGFSGGNDDENAKGISPAGSSSVLSSGFKSSASQQDGSLKSGEEGRIDPVGIHSEVISKPNMNGPSCCRHGGAKNHTPPPANTQFEETHNTQQDLRQPRIPCVSTTGNGPNGRTVSGFLYKYTNAAEVSIVCVCHGRSFSPAQFVEHAGGVNISHPLRHITVIPSTFHPFAS